MTTRAKKPKPQVMWGCWVVYKDGTEGWGESCIHNEGHGIVAVPFTHGKTGIGHVVDRYLLKDHIVLSATPKKVTLPVPEGGR